MLRDKLYCINCSFNIGANGNATTAVTEAKPWHRRLGHLSRRDVALSVKGTNGQQHSVCDVCANSKMHELPVPKWTNNRATAKGEIIFTVIQGSLKRQTMQGARYAISFIDDFSRYAVVKFMVHKKEAPEMYKLFIAVCGAPKQLRSNNDGEYSSRVLNSPRIAHKVKEEFTVPDTPQQNEVADRDLCRDDKMSSFRSQVDERLLSQSNGNCSQSRQFVSYSKQQWSVPL